MEGQMSDSTLPDADPACNGCHQIIEEGSVVSFGDHIWHVRCFRCAKCKTLVDHDSNLLLLSDGNPICENCSYNCRVCNLKIDDLAIMTGDESYHAECFRCRFCQKKIEDLVFAKTSQGIYCISCHNERMAKIRKSAKQNKLAESSGNSAAASQSSSPGAGPSSTQTLQSRVGHARDKSLPQIPRARPAGNTLRSFERGSGGTPSGGGTSLRTDSDMGSRVASQDSHRSYRRGSGEMEGDGQAGPHALKESGSIPLLFEEGQHASESGRQGSSRTVRDSSLHGVSHDATRSSVRERRNLNEMEVKVPKTVEQLEQAVQANLQARQSPVVGSGPGVVGAPVQTEGIGRRKSDQLAEEPAIRPPVRYQDITTPSAVRVGLMDGPTSHLDKGPTTPLTPRTVPPPVPSRSVDRQAAQSTDGNALISSPLHLSANTPANMASRLVNNGSTSSLNPRLERASPNGSSVTLTQDTLFLPQRDAPPTPGHQRQGSGPPLISPGRRHFSSKSLESSPLLPGLGSPGLGLESEFASALGFNEPTSGLGLSPQAGLDRSNTLSKFASKVLHRKSMSGGALPKSPARLRSETTPEASREAALEHELQAERKRNAELEVMLSQYKAAREVSSDIAARKRSLAALDMQIVQVEAKNDALLQQQYKLSDRTIPVAEWRKSVVADVNSSIRHTRDETSAEIQALIQERNDLRRENEVLMQYKQQKGLEMANMQQKHQDLQDMNEKLLKQIQSTMDNNKNGGGNANAASQARARNGSEGSVGGITYSNTAFGIPPSVSDNSFLSTTRQQVYQLSPQATASPQPQALARRPSDPRSTEPRLEHSESMDTVATFSSELDSKLYGSASRSDSASALGLGLGSEATSQSATPTYLDREPVLLEEETAVVEKVVNRLSGEVTELAPKKFKWKKGGLSKKTFRWGKNGGNNGSPSDLSTSIVSQPYDAVGSLPTGMSTSRSSDKISMYMNRGAPPAANPGGMFKRTWASHNNLVSELRNGSAMDGDFAYGTTPASNGSLSGLANINSAPGSLFGTDLVVRAGLEGRSIPGIITACVTYIEARALGHEGLYRKSGGAGAMKSLVEAFEQSSSEALLAQSAVSVDLSKFDDINAITSVLKQYLRKLPVPLIRFEAYEGFIGTSAIPDTDIRIRAVTDVLKDLPSAHFDTIRYLFRHLQKVSMNASSNLMTSRNLAVVLSPTVIWDYSGEKEMNDMGAKNQGVQFLIEQAHRL